MDLIFFKGTEIISVRIADKKLSFAKVQGQVLRFAPIEGLKFSEQGIKETFPDLANLPFEEMKKIAIERFQDKINKMKDEKEIAHYLVEDLSKHGYVIKLVNKMGFRPMTWDKFK